MVSLETSTNPNGGFSFESTSTPGTDVIQRENMDDISNVENGSNDNVSDDNSPLTTLLEPDFRGIKTAHVIFIQILSVILLEALMFLIPLGCDNWSDFCSDLHHFDLAVFVHSGFWFLELCFDRFYHYHQMKSRRHGYLGFYRKTRTIRSLPLIVISAGNSLLLVLIILVNKYCPDTCTSLDLEPIQFLQIFATVETLILIPIMITYLVMTIKFNRSRNIPDVNKEVDRSTFFPTQLKSFGYKDSSFITNLFENQAEMVRYLQNKNEKLTQKLYELRNSNVNGYIM